MKTMLYIALLIGITTSNFTFLGMQDTPGNITIELNCLAGAPFTITKAKPDPQIVTRGGRLTFKAVGSFNEKTNVQQLKVYTKINGVDAQTVFKNLPNAGLVEKDKSFVFSYEDSAPAFAPDGKYEVYMYLIDDKQKPVSCLKGTFTLDPQ